MSAPAASPPPDSSKDPSASSGPTLADFGGWTPMLATLTDGHDLSRQQAEAAMTEILGGSASPVQIAAMLIALRCKGETAEELTGFVTAMLDASEPLQVPADAIDIVGTGGSNHRRQHALNVSTMASIVAASAGAVVCKHGNRKASSTSGSFDFLEALGISIELGPAQLEACLDEIGLGFAFAKAYHPAMRFAGPVRVELGIPTVFNLLGPLANPGRVSRQVVGVASPELAGTVAGVLQATGSVSAMVVAGHDGLDELAITGDSVVVKVTPQGLVEQTVSPPDLGIDLVSADRLAGGTAADNVAIFGRILDGEPGPYRDIVQLNAAAGLVVGGRCATLAEGMAEAGSAIDDGRSSATLAALRDVTNRLSGPKH